MNSQKFDAHGGYSLGGPTNGFLDIEKLQIEKDPLPSLDEPLNHIRSRGGVEFETDFHERDLILNAIHESFGFGGGRNIQRQNQTITGLDFPHRSSLLCSDSP